MNVIQLSVISLAVLLSIPAVSYAHCDEVKHAGDHPHCSGNGGSGGKGGGGGDGSSQVIGVVDDDVSDPQAPLWAPTSVSPGCLMQKGPAKSMSGAFPRHALCATLYTEISSAIVPTLHDDIIVIVAADKNGVVQTVQVQGQDFIGSIGIVHISPLMVPSSVDNNLDGSIVIHVHADNVQMNKCDTHVLKQKSVCTIDAGLFAIDDLLYTTPP